MPRRILHYVKELRLEQGGVVRAMIDMCNLIARSGDEVTALATDPKDAPEAWKAPAPPPNTPKLVDIGRPAGPLGRFSAAQLARVRDLVSRHDVVHIHSMWTPSNVQIAALCRSLGVPYVLSVHGMLDDWSMSLKPLKKKIYLGLYGNRMLRSAGLVHCTAGEEMTQARRWIGHDRVRVAPLLFDLSSFRDLPGPEPALARIPSAARDATRLLFLSRLHPIKRLELVIDALAILTRSQPDAPHLIVAGTAEDPAYERSLLERAAAAGLAERVHFIGFISGLEKVSLYQACDLFIVPSGHENFGYVHFEALAAGTPALVTRGVQTWSELVATGGADLVEDSAEAIARAIPPRLTSGKSAMGAARDATFATLHAERVSRLYAGMYDAAREHSPNPRQAPAPATR